MLTKKAIEALKANETAKGRLATAHHKSTYTVIRWLYENNVMLTTAASLQIIREETGLSDEEILVQEPASK